MSDFVRIFIISACMLLCFVLGKLAERASAMANAIKVMKQLATQSKPDEVKVPQIPEDDGPKECVNSQNKQTP